MIRSPRPFTSPILACVVVGWTLVAAGCGGSKGGGPTPPIDPPQISCPADITQSEVSMPSLEVTYPAPTTTAGAAPVNVTCTPVSGTRFALGATTVACVARDAQSREASCSFSVTLKGFTLGAKKFLAAGDSLTAGENGLPSFIDVPNSYPTKLAAQLDMLYPGQDIVLINRGISGLRVEQLEEMLPGMVKAERPDAVLLMIGYNNLTTPCSPGRFAAPECDRAIDFTAVYTRDCIRRIKESPVGVKYIFVSTLVPLGPTGRIDAKAIVEVNRRVRLHIAAERATPVDSFAGFQGHEAEFVSPDGLHLLPPGYQAIADAFFSVIRLTIPQTPQLR
jgi:lysophospholipase L1-like esterase